MKNIIAFTAMLLLVLTSCEKNNLPEPIDCDGNDDCLFTLNNVNGKMIKMDCFDKYGVMLDNPNDPERVFIYTIPDDLERKYEVEDKAVNISGYCRTNILEPQFPDPSFNMSSIYQIQLTHIAETQ